jgi:hypothetical protein
MNVHTVVAGHRQGADLERLPAKQRCDHVAGFTAERTDKHWLAAEGGHHPSDPYALTACM